MIGAGFANMNQFDPDAGAFINVTGIGGIEAVAVNNLVNQLKNTGLWGRMKIVYPFVGNTAYSCKFNLMNPQDTDAAYRISFAGNMTYNQLGITGDGSTAYGNTFLKPLNAGSSKDDSHFAYYMRGITAAAGTDCGAAQGTTFYVNNARNATNNCRAYHNSINYNDVGFSGTSGFFCISRNNSTDFIQSINKTQTTATIASTTPPDYTCYIMAYNNAGTAANFRPRTMGLYTQGFGLTAAQINNLADINEQFCITLGRYA